MKPLCVIPARRNSKRLPLKNILPLAGIPMLAHSVKAALASRLFDRVFVSTEDREIGEIAAQHGATIHHRPPTLAGDLVSATAVCIDVYNGCRAVGDLYDAIVCLQPSSPLRTEKQICAAWEKFCVSDANYLVSVTKIDPHYFHWAIHQRGDNWSLYFGDEYLIERSLLPIVYRPNGSIKIGRVDAILARRNFFGPKLTVLETTEATSLHIAEKFDYDLAEFLLSRAKKEESWLNEFGLIPKS